MDLNADLGEGEPPEVTAGVLAAVTTTHVACGFHAGQPSGIRATLAAAVAAGVAVGAHPSYPDRPGFGRRELDRSPTEILDDLIFQIGALEALARVEGTAVVSVKPHGALYHRLDADPEAVWVVAAGLAASFPGLRLVLPAGSPALAVVRSAGVVVVPEAFCDRAYGPDGRLRPRTEVGAVLEDPAAAAAQAVRLAVEALVTTALGIEVALTAETLCLHGDTPGAPAMAGAVRRALTGAGVRVTAPS